MIMESWAAMMKQILIKTRIGCVCTDDDTLGTKVSSIEGRHNNAEEGEVKQAGQKGWERA